MIRWLLLWLGCLLLPHALAQTWYPYMPGLPCTPMPQCVYPEVEFTVRQLVDPVLGPYFRADLDCFGRLELTGWTGDFVGEFWVYLDPDTTTTPGTFGDPLLFSNLYVLDAQLWTGTVWQLAPEVLTTGAANGGWLQVQPAQMGGTAFAFDLQQPIGRITIGRLYYAASLAPGLAASVQFHFFGNMQHEFAGSGWFYESYVAYFVL